MTIEYPSIPQNTNLPPVPVAGQNTNLPPPPSKTIPPPTKVTHKDVSQTIQESKSKSGNTNSTNPCSYNVFVMVMSLFFIIVQIGLIVTYGVFTGINGGNSGFYTLMIFNIVFGAINLLVGLFNLITNVSVIDCMRDCLRPVQYILYVVGLIAFCVLGVIAVLLNAFIFIFSSIQSLLIMAVVVICINFVAFSFMIILSSINVGWVRCKLNRA
ncbi:hypothetical protein AKO1_010212 [Acrasis kona]|uniref:Uncharacterized protein n=1 Tax=Acrasis kona TaxID=1008807 RepID=A0AAW2ZT44_9EUKA